MLNLKELNRRDFLKICTIVTAIMGLPYSMVKKVEAAMKRGPKTHSDLVSFYGMHRLHRSSFESFLSFNW